MMESHAAFTLLDVVDDGDVEEFVLDCKRSWFASTLTDERVGTESAGGLLPCPLRLRSSALIFLFIDKVTT